MVLNVNHFYKYYSFLTFEAELPHVVKIIYTVHRRLSLVWSPALGENLSQRRLYNRISLLFKVNNVAYSRQTAGLIGLKFFLDTHRKYFFLKFEKNRLADPALFNASDYPAVNELPSP